MGNPTHRRAGCTIVLAAGLLVLGQAAAVAGGSTELVSMGLDGSAAYGRSHAQDVSRDGRYVVFYSTADDLVAGDSNGTHDVFLRDRSLRWTERISVSSTGRQGNGISAYSAAVSADGRYVAFTSDASNLVPGDTNGVTDVFLRDRAGGTTTRVSVASDGSQGSNGSQLDDISADGSQVLFSSGAKLSDRDTNGFYDAYVHDRTSRTTSRVSVGMDGQQGNGDSGGGALSPDGRYIVFGSGASNLVSGDTNGQGDTFLRDRVLRTTRLVSVSSTGRQANSYSSASGVSADGRYVLFESGASNLVRGDTNGYADVFLRDRQAGTTKRVSVGNTGAQGNEDSYGATMSDNGRYVAFESTASNLVANDRNGLGPDVFVRDLVAPTTTIQSVDSAGRQSGVENTTPHLSADGTTVAFTSTSAHFDPKDTNTREDVFVHMR